MQTELTKIRWARRADATALAALHAEAWRYAYRGVIPALALERMIARRAPSWWAQLGRRRNGVLILEFDQRVAGYARLGRNRSPALSPRGEIFELYLQPEFQGVGLGKLLFAAARAELKAHGLSGLAIWALAENHLACRFYQAMGGVEGARGQEMIGGARLELVAYCWS